nr:NADH:flavin oxidoreductase [Rodentibacter genomosp. 1]
MNPKYAPLFEPYTLNNGVEIKNSLTVAPLTIYDSGKDGEMTEAGRRFWQDRFKGFGLYIMPFTNVHPSGIGFESPNAFDERHLPSLREYAQIAHAQGAKAVVQRFACRPFNDARGGTGGGNRRLLRQFSHNDRAGSMGYGAKLCLCRGIGVASRL